MSDDGATGDRVTGDRANGDRANGDTGDRSDGRASRVHPRTAVLLVALREIRTRLWTKSFMITTGVLLVAIIGGVLAVHLIGGRDSATEVGVTDPAFARPLTAAAASLDEKVTVRTLSDEAAGTREVRDGRLDVLVTGPAQAPRVFVERELSPPLQSAVTAIARQTVLDQEIRRVGGDPGEIGRTVSAVRIDVRRLDPEAEGYGERIGISMFTGILIYLVLLIYGQAVAQGVVEEKSSRIVELLLTAIRPWQLMLGKVLGIGAVGLLQLLVTLGAGVGAALALGAFTVPASVLTGTAAWTLVWFLVGFLMYALMFAAAGALVSRQEDAGSVVTPVMTLIIVPYIVGVTALPADPDGTLVTVLSLIPVFSPTLMPMRMALGAPGWQIALSLTLSVLLVAALVQLSGRVYRNAILRTGTRVRLTDAFRDA